MKNEYFVWHDQEEWDKMIGQFRLKIGGLLSVFNCYGMDVYVQGVQDQIVKAAIDLTMRARGEDRPIAPDIKLFVKPTE